MNKRKTVFIWLLRSVAAIIMLQTLFFKFSAANESVYIFTKLGIEPWGRIGSGIAELIASILILIPKTTWYGALLGLGIMAGAILSHITKLGFVVLNDRAQLFIYACIVFVACFTLIIIEKNKILQLLNRK